MDAWEDNHGTARSHQWRVIQKRKEKKRKNYTASLKKKRKKTTKPSLQNKRNAKTVHAFLTFP